jgi:hypothetical protein
LASLSISFSVQFFHVDTFSRFETGFSFASFGSASNQI